MRCFFIVLFALVLFGCGGGGLGGSDTAPDYSARVFDWQDREVSCPAIETVCPNGNDLFWDLAYIIDQLPQIAYDNSFSTYWKSSCESVSTPSGSCKDAAVLAYRAISDSCLVEQYGITVRIRSYDTDAVYMENTNHPVVVIYHSDGVYEVSNLVLSGFESDLPIVLECTMDEVIF